MKYRGKRCLLLVRCSTDQQKETSIPAQLELLHRFAAAKGMAVVDKIILDGVSGSKPGARDDIQQILDRKRIQNDFEILLVQTEDRLTRGGVGHGAWIQYGFMMEGIEIVFASSDAPNGPFADVIRDLKYHAAQETVKATSLRSCQGYQRALERRNVATSSHAPYGTHRLYCSAEGKPLYIIRDNRDGTQHKLHHETREVLEAYGTVGGGAKGHYRKRKDELVYMVMGEDAEVAVVRRIFRWRYMEGWGDRRIANILNSEGIKTPMGKRWTARNVQVVAENPIYTAQSVANRVGSGRFNQRAKGQPQQVELDPMILATKKTIPIRLRDQTEWFIQDQPYLKEFLSEPLRTVAAKRIHEIWAERCRPSRQKRINNPHSDSAYLLTNILTCKQDGRRLKGSTSGKSSNYTRYYAHSIAQKDPIAAGFPNTTFRADVLEAAVLQILAETLKAMPTLKEEVEKAVDAAMAAQRPQSSEQIDPWRAQHAQLSKKITAILKTIADDADFTEAKAVIADLRSQQNELQKKIDAAVKAESKTDVQSRDAMVASMMERLANLGAEIQNLPIYQLKQVLGMLIESMTADMLTREIQIKVRIPQNAVIDVKTALSELSLRQTLGSSTDAQAHGLAASSKEFTIALIVCEFSRLSQKPCFTCRRRSAA